MKLLLCALVALFIAVPAATASTPQSWWTEDFATSVVLDSDWAFVNDVLDADCTGWGGYRTNADGDELFNRFECTVYQDDTSSYCLPGECSGPSLIDTYVIRIRAIGLKTFVILGRRGVAG